MKLSILLMTAALVLPVTGWSASTSSSQSHHTHAKVEAATPVPEPENMFERGLMGVHKTLEPVGNTLKHGAQSIEHGVRGTGKSMKHATSGTSDQEHSKQHHNQQSMQSK